MVISESFSEIRKFYVSVYRFNKISHEKVGTSVYRCLAAGIRQRTTACERCSEAAYPT